MTRIADVAREVNVSTATVSRALRGLPGVTAETRALVLEAALRLGYTPSPSAVRLASGRTRSVAVVVPYLTRWYFSTVTSGVEGALRVHQYDLLLYNLAGSPTAREQVFKTDLLTKRVDAVVVVGLRPSQDELARLHGLGRPVVFVGVEVPGCGNVCIDDASAARTATEHLVSLGHRDVAHVGGPGSAVLDSTTPQARQEAFHAAMSAAGLDVPTAWDVDGLFTLDGGVAAGRRLLDSPRRPTAVFCASDEMAIGVMRAASEAGLEVPRDLSVIGIDDHELASFFGLTTVAQPAEEQGWRAADVLIEAVESHADPRALTERIVLPTGLVVRGTTGPPVTRPVTLPV